MSEIVQARSRRRIRLWALWFGLAAAPALWFVQLVAGYALWAQGCYPGDHPAVAMLSGSARALTFAVDAVAIGAALVAGLVSYVAWRTSREDMDANAGHHLLVAEDRARFLAMWGMLSSGCFLAGIVFATIMSVWVPSCG